MISGLVLILFIIMIIMLSFSSIKGWWIGLFTSIGAMLLCSGLTIQFYLFYSVIALISFNGICHYSNETFVNKRKLQFADREHETDMWFINILCITVGIFIYFISGLMSKHGYNISIILALIMSFCSSGFMLLSFNFAAGWVMPLISFCIALVSMVLCGVFNDIMCVIMLALTLSTLFALLDNLSTINENELIRMNR